MDAGRPNDVPLPVRHVGNGRRGEVAAGVDPPSAMTNRGPCRTRGSGRADDGARARWSPLAGTVRMQQPTDRWTEIDGLQEQAYSIFSKLLKRPAAAPAEPEVFVAAFGKGHPAWDDHPDDLGLRNALPGQFQERALQRRHRGEHRLGCGRNSTPQRVETWGGHDLLWWMGNDVTVGRLWPLTGSKAHEAPDGRAGSVPRREQRLAIDTGDTLEAAVARRGVSKRRRARRSSASLTASATRSGEQARANPGAIERDPRQFALLAQALHAEPEEAEAVGDASFGRAIYAIEREAAAAGFPQDAGKAARRAAAPRPSAPRCDCRCRSVGAGPATDVQTQAVRSAPGWIPS